MGGMGLKKTFPLITAKRWKTRNAVSSHEFSADLSTIAPMHFIQSERMVIFFLRRQDIFLQNYT